MDNQFNDLSIPDPNEYFHCSPTTQSFGFTHLMKLVLMANNINAINLIKEIITNNPKETDKQNEKGWSALMIASRNSATRSNVEIVKLLLEAGSNPNLQDIYGCTALMYASGNSNRDSNIETVKLLLEAGSDPNLQSNCGWSALMLASYYSNRDSNIETVKLLLEVGSNPNLQHNDGCTALYLLLKHGKLEKDVECVEGLILVSQLSIPVDGSLYDLYLERNVNILNDHVIRILKGEIVMNKTKSARN